MHVVTHLLSSWMVANSVKLERKDRALVTLAGTLPDLDGLGVIAEIVSESASAPVYWWTDYHHALCHNIFFSIILCLLAACLGKRKSVSMFLAFTAFHLHLFFDLIGSGGPDGYQWPIYYFFPVFKEFSITWQGQWALNAWPNIFLTIMLMASTIYMAWRYKYSPLEMISGKADSEFVRVLERWFG